MQLQLCSLPFCCGREHGIGISAAMALYGAPLVPHRAAVPPTHPHYPHCAALPPNLLLQGLTEEQAAASHGALNIYTTSFRPMRNTISGSPLRDFMKVGRGGRGEGGRRMGMASTVVYDSHHRPSRERGGAAAAEQSMTWQASAGGAGGSSSAATPDSLSVPAH